MSARYGGSGVVIVNVSSMAAARGGFAGRVRYAITKAALDALTVGLAREVAIDGIRVNGVRPGPTATDIHTPFGGPSFLEAVRAKVPRGRIGDAGEVASAIAWLASAEASFITGTVVDVAGGQ